ncbi:putative kinesin family member 21A [Operophtera brumata]|uniref:Putative kinesin family member 21A n=1 Tax=Operophtera brumata TaxID=104452 RepID=A0A0L7LBC2_OPEBR|nr:putative kinesin family member 21A [Operophtera brumata]
MASFLRFLLDMGSSFIVFVAVKTPNTVPFSSGSIDKQGVGINAWEASNRRLLEPPHYDGVQALAMLHGDTLYSASRDSSLKRCGGDVRAWRIVDQ